MDSPTSIRGMLYTSTLQGPDKTVTMFGEDHSKRFDCPRSRSLIDHLQILGHRDCLILIESHGKYQDMCKIADEYTNSEMAKLACNLTRHHISHVSVDIRYGVIPNVMHLITEEIPYFDVQYYCNKFWYTKLREVIVHYDTADSIFKFMVPIVKQLMSNKFPSERLRFIKLSSVLVDAHIVGLIGASEQPQVCLIAGYFHCQRVKHYLQSIGYASIRERQDPKQCVKL